MSTVAQRVVVRPLMREDLEDVAAISFESLKMPWSRERLVVFIIRGGMGSVVELDGELVGFVLFRPQSFVLQIECVAVAKRFRRRGAGTHLVNSLYRRLSAESRAVWVDVPETDLDAQLFFRACYMTAVRVLPADSEGVVRYRFITNVVGHEIDR